MGFDIFRCRPKSFRLFIKKPYPTVAAITQQRTYFSCLMVVVYGESFFWQINLWAKRALAFLRYDHRLVLLRRQPKLLVYMVRSSMASVRYSIETGKFISVMSFGVPSDVIGFYFIFVFGTPCACLSVYFLSISCAPLAIRRSFSLSARRIFTAFGRVKTAVFAFFVCRLFHASC